MNKQQRYTKPLSETHPELAKQWHPTKNGDLTPDQITAGSDTKKIWWQCSIREDHDWESVVYNRANGPKSGCPCCSGHKVAFKDSLAYIHPGLVAELHPDKNSFFAADIRPNQGNKKAWWICVNDKSHIYETLIRTRVKNYIEKTNSCPLCNSLAIVKPELAEQFHPTKNGSKTPFDFLAHCHDVVWWLCPTNSKHEWQAKIDNRMKGRNCPECSNKKINEENSLASLYPLLVAEWHVDKNLPLTPHNVGAGSGKEVWWQCKKDSRHIWLAAIEFRTKRSYGCPYCNSGWTIKNVQLFVRDLLPYLDTLDPVDLYDLFQEHGLNATNGQCKAFLKALKTGRFPKDELEKFSNHAPSLVDDFIKDQAMTLDDQQDDELLGVMSEEDGLYIEKDLPIVQTKDIFDLLDSNILTTSSNVEKVEYFIKKFCSKIWQHTYVNEQEAQKQLALYQGNNECGRRVRDLFCQEYNGAKSLKIPTGYSFDKQPNLMQRHIAYLLQIRKRIGNWSGTGTGKTLSAILASRVIKARSTVICCPNNVIDNWKRQIMQAYPDSIIHTKEKISSLKTATNKFQYLILNYEFFQSDTCRGKLEQLIERCEVDFIVIDEIHYAKQRDIRIASKRKTNIFSFVSVASQKNDNLHVLGMSATPVINHLLEGKTLIELVAGIYYEELDTKLTVRNCVALYKKFITCGIRYVPEYNQQLNTILENIDCTPAIEELKGHKTYLELESKLTQFKIPYILEQLRPKTIVYTHYREGIEIQLQEAIRKAGWKVALFNGDEATKRNLNAFIDGDVDVLIATSCIGTGVDRLQYVCNRLIINCLPWTHAEYKQLIGRIYRQGQKNNHVDIIVPLAFIEINGERRSRCEYRWECIKRKKTFADAAIDGTIPDGHLKTKEQVHKEFMLWLQQVENSHINEIERQKIILSLSGETTKIALRKISDLTQMSGQINDQLSSVTHQRFLDNSQTWHDYHAVYRETRKNWEIIPYQEAIKWCKARPHWIVGDFGCGEAFLAQELPNKVYSFDHIAINENVISCDMSKIALSDNSLDAAVFSLSLMGTNFIDYLREAKRCLKLDGHLWIAEPTSRITDINIFKSTLEYLGFDCRFVDTRGKFTFIEALKSDRASNEAMLKLIDKNILN